MMLVKLEAHLALPLAPSPLTVQFGFSLASVCRFKVGPT